MEKRECACGCKTLIDKFDNRGRERRFVLSHNNKGRIFTETHRNNIRKAIKAKYDSGQLDWLKKKNRDLHYVNGAKDRYELVYQYYGKKCCRCGIEGELKLYWKSNPIKRITLEIHHIIPILFRGTHDIENLRLYCQKCHKEIERRRYKSMREIYFKLVQEGEITEEKVYEK